MTGQLTAIIILCIPLLTQAQESDSARVSIHQLEAQQHRWDDLKTDAKVPELQRANDLVRQGKVDEGARVYRKLIKRSRSRALFNLGLVAYQQGSFRDALRWFRSSYQVRRDPKCLSYIQNVRRIIREHSPPK